MTEKQKIRVGIVHHNLNSRGGGERVAVNTIELLKQMNYEVVLVTTQRPDFERLQEAYDRKVKVDEVRTTWKFRIPYLGIYQRLLTTVPAKHANVDLMINTHGDIIPYPTRMGKTITYCHFPSMLLLDPAYDSKYQGSFFWKNYYKPYRHFVKKYADETIEKTRLLTNSEFSKRAIKQVYQNVEPEVVYPPVDTERFKKLLLSPYRQDRVLIVSRFTKEKQLHLAFEIASKKIPVVIVGSLIPANQSYYNWLVKTTVELELQDYLKFVPNASFVELQKQMSLSKVYLHTFRGEHFGISIVEAMSAGLIPVVPNYGGCSEFTPREFQYQSTHDMLPNVLDAMKVQSSERKRMSEIADRFSEYNFKARMSGIIEEELGIVKKGSL